VATIGERLGDASLQAGAAALRTVERYLLNASLVPTTPFLDPALLPWTAALERRYPEIRAELDEVLRYRDELPNFQDISVDQATITDDDRWKTFFFYGYGFTAGKNVERCPETARLLNEIPGMTTAMFSILSPHKKIPPHGGPYKGVLRYHLGLLVPEPAAACGIRVGGDVRHWAEGQSLVFDDTHEHEAWNDTDGIRVVLFVDVKRPLSGPARWLNEVVLKGIGFSPFIQDAKARHNAWERRFEAMRGA